MGVMDKVKGMLGGHKDQAGQGIDKAAGVADQKTGGTHTDQITSAADKGKDEINKLEGG